MAYAGTPSGQKSATREAPEASTATEAPKASEAAQAEKNNRATNRVAITTAILGLIAAVITLGAAVVPSLQIKISSLRNQVSTQQSAIGEQRKQISKLKAQAVPNAPEGGSYLSNVTPIINDYYDAQTGPVVIGGVTYPDSVTFFCNGSRNSAPLAYPVSGTEFTAVIGYGPTPGDADQNETATVTITDQTGRILGDRIEVAPGHPLRVGLPLNGVSRLGFTCTYINTQTGITPVQSPRITLANAST
jgi:cell division protein FtsL